MATNDLPLEKTILVDNHQCSSNQMISSPLFTSYNDIVRPLLDTVHKLGCMNVIDEGTITLPTIVVIGDQSSGKSSVIESLTGISLPCGIRTRVPLIIRLQHHSDSDLELHLRYQGKNILVKTSITEAITLATKNIAGIGEWLSNVPLTLVVKKNSFPDLTIVDLPGIPVHDQSNNNSKKLISDIIAEYIKPEESVILNVMSANTNFLTCESRRMSHNIDKTGVRTINVFTKADKVSEDIVTIVTTSMDSDYVCVRNRLKGEAYQVSQNKELDLFKTHRLLSKIDKRMVGTPVLAQKVVQNQLAIISRCLYRIVKKINEDLNMCALKHSKLQQNFTTTSEAVPIFVQVIKMSSKSFSKITISREFDDFPYDIQMHYFKRLSEIFTAFSQELKNNLVTKGCEIFEFQEIQLLEEGKGFGSTTSTLLEHVSRSLLLRKIGTSTPALGVEHIFNSLIRKNICSISITTDSFISKVWDYIEVVMVKVLLWHTKDYPQLYLLVKCVTENVISTTKERFKEKVLEFFDMKNMEDLKRHPQVIYEWNELNASRCIMYKKDQYISELRKLNDASVYVKREHLEFYSETTLSQVLDLKTRMVVFWKVVLKMFIESVESHLRVIVHRFVETEMEDLVTELKSDGGNSYKRMLKESPLMTTKRWKLKTRIELLEKLKNVVEETLGENSLHV